MLKPYKTIDGCFTATQTIEKSRFIGTVAGVENVDEAANFVLSIKKKYFDATHNCFAYFVTEGQKFSDDGEPCRTAGLPISDIIKKSGLTNICITVTRYFGGVKLGASGLVRAYSSTASLVLEEADIIEYSLHSSLTAVCPYSFFPTLKTSFEAGGIIENIVYNENVTVYINVLSEKSDSFIAEIINRSNGAVMPIKNRELLLPSLKLRSKLKN